jgi:hypothetical protein
LNKSFFTAKNLSERHNGYDTGNPVKIIGFRSDYDFEHNTCPEVKRGEIKPITENDVASPKYRQFLFAVKTVYPVGFSGSPVILDGSYNSNFSEILLGICSGYNFKTDKGIVTFADTINDIILHGITLHKQKRRSS